MLAPPHREARVWGQHNSVAKPINNVAEKQPRGQTKDATSPEQPKLNSNTEKDPNKGGHKKNGGQKRGKNRNLSKSKSDKRTGRGPLFHTRLLSDDNIKYKIVFENQEEEVNEKLNNAPEFDKKGMFLRSFY